MEYKFSEKIKGVKASAIREILKATASDDIISFAAGSPSEEAFPVEEIKAISASVFENEPLSVLKYGISEGYPKLRAQLKDYLKSKYNIGTEQDDILILSGAQQAIDITAHTLINDGDVVLCESPSFVGALNAIKSNGAKLVGVELEQDGVNIEQLKKAISENSNIKFFYIIPNFQNPSGVTTSLEKRKAIYEICKQNNILIVEDNPYGDLRFKGDNVPAIKSLDDSGIVVYCGSFSKILAPGIRVGHLTADKGLISKLTVAKQASDVHSNAWAQMICSKYMEKYSLDEHINNIVKIYEKKCALMENCIDKYFDPSVQRISPDGGLFIWCTMPDRIDIAQFCQKAIERKVAVVPGNAFMPYDDMPCHSFRMNYSTPSDEQIEQGIRILGELSKELLA